MSGNQVLPDQVHAGEDAASNQQQARLTEQESPVKQSSGDGARKKEDLSASILNRTRRLHIGMIEQQK